MASCWSPKTRSGSSRSIATSSTFLSRKNDTTTPSRTGAVISATSTSRSTQSTTSPTTKKSGVGAIKLAFNVFDAHALAAKLEARGVELLYPPKDTGFFISVALLDPDGNFIEITELVNEWFEMLEERRKKDLDIVDRWKAVKRRSAD